MDDIDRLLAHYVAVSRQANYFADQAAALKARIGALMQEEKYETVVDGRTTSVVKYRSGSRLRIVDLLTDGRVVAAGADRETFSNSTFSVTKFREWAEEHGWPAEEQERFISKEGKEVVKITTGPQHEEEGI